MKKKTEQRIMKVFMIYFMAVVFIAMTYFLISKMVEYPPSSIAEIGVFVLCFALLGLGMVAGYKKFKS